MTIRRRVLVVMSVFVALTLVIATAALASVIRRDQALTTLRERLEPARQLTSDLVTAVADQESGIRGYVITSDESFLEPYRAGRARERAARQRLGRLLAHDPTLTAALERAEAAIERWHTEAAEPELRAAAGGDPELAMALVRSEIGRRSFDDVRDGLGDLRAELFADEQEVLDRFDQARRQVTATLVAMVALAVLMILAVATVLRSWVTRPLRRLSADVDVVAGGALDEQISAQGPRDIAELAAAVDRMRQQLVAEIEGVRRAQQGMEQQAPAADLLWHALRPAAELDELPAATWAAGAVRLAAKGVLAGDFYDVLEDDERLCVALVDVSGHGAGAGTLALEVKHLLAAALREGRDPGSALEWVAGQLGDTGDRFFTAFVAELPHVGEDARFANAGHPPALVSARDGVLQQLEPTGPLVGPLPGSWVTMPFRLAVGTSLVCYTDGLTDPRDGRGEAFGEGRLEAALADYGDLAGENLVAALIDEVRRFSAETFADDVTVVAVTRVGAPQEIDA